MMKKWEDIGSDHLCIMREMGHFSPTVNKEDRQVKGWMSDFDDGGVTKVYWTSKDLREIAESFIIVADWLDERAKEEE
jgi:poly(3-hydroxyalkanoate) synthetase